MPLKVNLRQLTRDSVHLDGEISAAELDLDTKDPMVQVKEPLHYDLEVQQLEQNILAQGELKVALDCECVRCLKPFKHNVMIEDWACHLPLEGEDRATIVDDSVDLTQYIREDILLAFPVHPVCKPECVGLTGANSGAKKKSSSQAEKGPSAWAELDKLKFRS
jgi:uncharacterized protein